MNDQLPDRTVLLLILATLLLVFFLVFSFKSDKITKVKSAITRRANPASKRLTRLNQPRKSPFGRKKFK